MTVFQRWNSFGFLLLPLLLTSCAKVDKEAAYHHNNLGVALMDAHEFEQAAKEFEAALKAWGDFLEARINLGIACFYWSQSEGRRQDVRDELMRKAVEQLSLALRQDPDNPYAHYVLGLAAEMDGKSEEAKKHFEAVVKKDPLDADAWSHLGLSCFRLRRFDEAVKAARRAFELVPYHFGFYWQLYQALLRAKRFEEAKRLEGRWKRFEQSGQVRITGKRKPLKPYATQGKYAEAIPVSLPPTKKKATENLERVRFMDAAKDAGLAFRHNGPGQDKAVLDALSGKPMTKAWFEKNKEKLIAALGSGASFCDFDLDGKLDIFLVNCNGRHALYQNKGGGKFEEVTQRAGVGGKRKVGMGCAWGDYNNDGYPDLLITYYGGIELYRNKKNGTFEDVTQKAKLAVPPDRWCTGCAFADYDHDGDLDIYVCCYVDMTRLPSKPTLSFPHDFSGQPNLLFRNNGSSEEKWARLGTFTEFSKETKTDGGKHRSTQVLFADINHDRAVDFFLVETFFRESGSLDSLEFLNSKDGTFHAVPFRQEHLRSAWWVDRDNNGTPETNLLTGLWKDTAAYGDYDNDGDTDHLVNNNGALAKLFRNESGSKNNWIKVRLEGLWEAGDKQGNRMGVGAKVEVRDVGLWLRRELQAGSGYLSCDSPELVFGIGKRKQVDFVRVTFPSGARISVPNVKANQTLTIKEPKAFNSCPMIFTWNGRRFEFITDVIGGGIVGEQGAPGHYWIPDPDEYLKIEGSQLRPKDGAYDIRFVNPLEETYMPDQIKLLAVDHPASVEVFPNERLVVRPPRPKFRLFAISKMCPPSSAVDHHGHDVLPSLLKIDRRYFDEFKVLFKGIAKPWSLTLDLGTRDKGQRTSNESRITNHESRVVLLIYGWTDWNSSSSAFAAWQAGINLWGPKLEVIGKDGRWKVITDDMGVPAGLPRWMTFDITGIFPTKDHRIRISSNRTVYFDQILVGFEIVGARGKGQGTRGTNHESRITNHESRITNHEPRTTNHESRFILHPLPLLSAHLHWLGYPKRRYPDGKPPEVYDYQDIEPSSEQGIHQGMFTRYGDVKALLQCRDDMFVIMSHGEEIALRFDAKALPSLPRGWTRDFLLYVDGFGKSMDLHAAFSDTVEPLPFHKMSGYPYKPPESYPQDETHLRYLFEFNTRPGFSRF